MFDIHLRNLLWMYCPGHAGVKGNDRADRVAGKATIISGLRMGSSEVFRIFGYNVNDIIHDGERSGVERGSTRRPVLKGMTERESDEM